MRRMAGKLAAALQSQCAAAALACTIAMPASATDLGILYPASDADLRPLSWTGFIISPSFGYETLKFHGNGSPALKTAKGVGLGAEIGYDWQANGYVLGVVGNVAGANINGDSTDGRPQALKSRMDAYGMVRGRIGLPMDRLLVFATAGAAFGRLQIENQPLGLSDRQVLSGWAAGGGVEWVYNAKITLRAEYIHVDLAEKLFTSFPASAGSRGVGATFDMVKLGLVTRY